MVKTSNIQNTTKDIFKYIDLYGIPMLIRSLKRYPFVSWRNNSIPEAGSPTRLSRDIKMQGVTKIKEVSKIIKNVTAHIEHSERAKREKTLLYFKSIIENRDKPLSAELVKKLNKLRDHDFVQSLNHSIIIDEKTGKTGLMLAIETGNFQIFDLFLRCYIEQGCSLNARDYNRKDATWYALQSVTYYLVEKICNALQANFHAQESINTI